MASIIILIIGLIIGFLLAYYMLFKQKWGDKAQVLNEKWKRNIAELEKRYEIKLEQSNTFTEKIREENKTQLEKLSKEWQVKYIQDIEELKKMFKDSEKIIKLKSVSSSRRSLVGKFIERFVPFLSKIPFMPADMFFLGQPIDYIIFDGLHEDNIQKVIFLEVKTGEGKLTKREKGLKETIQNKQVYWREVNIDTSSDKIPDHKIQNEETTLKEFYNDIDNKLKTIKIDKKATENKNIEPLDPANLIELRKPIKPEVSLTVHKKGGKRKKKVEISCPACGRGINTELEMREGFEFKIKCPNCGRLIRGDTEIERTWICEYCSKKFNTKEEVERHEKNCPGRRLSRNK